MSGLEIRGRDVATEAYRVTAEIGGERVTALVPERLVDRRGVLPGRPSHEDAYGWIARNRENIMAAMAALRTGARRPRPPFDDVMLVEED